MDSRINGPLSEACDAQVRLATATADFIKFVGFQPQENENDLIGDRKYIMAHNETSDMAKSSIFYNGWQE